MDWFPVIAGTFKVLVLCTGMFFAIKWHYEQGKKRSQHGQEKRSVLRGAGTAAAVFVLALLVLGLVTFALLRGLSLDLTLP